MWFGPFAAMVAGILLAQPAAAGEAPLGLTFRPVLQQPADMSEADIFPYGAELEPPIIVSRVILLGESDVQCVALFEGSEPWETGLQFVFTAEGGRKFAAVSSGLAGQHIAVMLDGSVVSAPYLNVPALGSEVVINGMGREQAMEALQAIIASTRVAACPS